ncbi:hypothetical protein [Chryseobacterium sp. 2987]|uniref:hypothetical protein n=1 Tax=Chryseobacterium sp. 2987 TaxID=2817767 RepID=UPI0028675FEC|nr:hypothetical protein [Chryseobacterium sp. 2987]MDR6921684.1 hypothetical protein [Chryseobacterium sp. 2987]
MKKLLMLLFAAITTMTFAQNKINYEWGNFDFLKGQTEVNVQLKFNNVVFHEKNLTEAEYLENRKADITAKKGEAAWGNWAVQWGEFKECGYLEHFLNGINNKSKKIVFKSNAATTYTLIIDTKWVYAGWYGGFIGSQEGKLTSELAFVETDNPSKIIMKLQGDKILGKKMNSEFSWEYGRIAAAYEATGKLLGKAISKEIK